MDRRTFVALTAATVTTSRVSRTAVVQTSPKAKSVLLRRLDYELLGGILNTAHARATITTIRMLPTM
jgi:hypothetical protein